MTHILRIDASMRHDGSTTRTLTDATVEKLAASGATVTTRDLADGVQIIDQDWIGANFTEPQDRTPQQVERLTLSDTLIAELQAADIVVIGMPIYNFGVPAALKAWIDQVARARVTFRYTENGPEGLLIGKRAIIVAASGGTGVDSDIDFATPYLRHALGFIGIHDVQVIAADQQMMNTGALDHAKQQVQDLAA